MMTSKTFRGSVAISEGRWSRLILRTCLENGLVVAVAVVAWFPEVDIVFIFGECCQEFRFLRCDLQTRIENYDERSEGTQRMRRITDQLDSVPQFFCGFEDRNGPVRRLH